MSKKHRDRVVLVAEDEQGAVVEALDVPLQDYYDSLVPVVDSNLYRAERGIRRLTGQIYGYQGNLMQTFDAEYDVGGAYLRRRAVHEDGTVTQD